MPRQDVPYGGAICRLKERIAELFDKLGEKLHTINGVPGDGDGNVKIVSGSSAVVISNDPTQNEIAVSLDTSQLPAASVSSVNGQTGAVALDAGDIPSDGNSDVQSDIDALQTMDGALQGNINAEALARQNADSALQTNINAATAAIPGEVTQQIANNARINQIENDLNILGNSAILTTGNQSKSGVLQFNTNFSRGCTADDVLQNPTANYGATVFSLIDRLGQTTHNSIGNFTKVRNASGQNYIDINNISYGFYEDGVQKRIDAFIRILILENSGSVQFILFRQKRDADGTGTVSTVARTLATINYNE